MKEKTKQEIPIPFKLDEFFTTQNQRDNDKKEKIEEIDISLIDNFKNHPFKVANNSDLKLLQESIKLSGLLSPTIVRRKSDGRYEMISGHRRKYACNLLGMDKIKCIIKDLSDDEATIFMVDSNLQREKLFPSEKAFAYKMKYDALKRQRKSNVSQLNTEVCRVGTVVRSDSILSGETGESARNIQRYIRLTNLIPEILQLVDNYEQGVCPSIALSPAVELSYLKTNEQKIIFNYIEYNNVTPSLSQAIKFKELSKNNLLNNKIVNEILDKVKPNQIPKYKINEEKLFNVIPKNISKKKIEDYIIKACEYYSKYLKQRDRESR